MTDAQMCICGAVWGDRKVREFGAGGGIGAGGNAH